MSSESTLMWVHEKLAHVIVRARERYPFFIVTEGLRSKVRQADLVAKGKSKTMNSRHLTGHAVDIACLRGGKVTWDFKEYEKAAKVIKECAKELGVSVVWGGDWETLRDGPHFELDRNVYPTNRRDQ